MARHWIQGQSPLGRIYSSDCIVNWETVEKRQEVKLCGPNIAVWRNIFKIKCYCSPASEINLSCRSFAFCLCCTYPLSLDQPFTPSHTFLSQKEWFGLSQERQLMFSLHTLMMPWKLLSLEVCCFSSCHMRLHRAPFPSLQHAASPV